MKTTSKQVINNLKKYLVEGAVNCDYIEGDTFEQVAPQIAKAFNSEQLGTNIHGQSILDCYYKGNLFEAFEDWVQGLPSAINGEDIYLHTCVNTLGDILEESEQERAKFTEDQAEKKMVWLLFRTLKKHIFREVYGY